MKSLNVKGPYGTKQPRLKIGGSPLFQRACLIAKILPTRRQWSKWESKKGTAYGFINQAKAELAAEAK